MMGPWTFEPLLRDVWVLSWHSQLLDVASQRGALLSPVCSTPALSPCCSPLRPTSYSWCWVSNAAAPQSQNLCIVGLPSHLRAGQDTRLKDEKSGLSGREDKPESVCLSASSTTRGGLAVTGRALSPHGWLYDFRWVALPFSASAEITQVFYKIGVITVNCSMGL